MQEIPKQTANAILGVMVFAIILLVSLVIYNYTRSGVISYTSIIIAMLLGFIVLIFRSKREK